MPQTPALAAPPIDDTPVDERPPYDEPARWPWLVFLALLALAVVAGVVLVVALVRAAYRRLRHGDRTEVIMFPTVWASDAGGAPTYRVEFYDGAFRQLRDRPLSVALPEPHGATADATLAALARECVALVESRDGQRCFDPVVEVYDERDRLVRRYEAARP